MQTGAGCLPSLSAPTPRFSPPAPLMASAMGSGLTYFLLSSGTASAAPLKAAGCLPPEQGEGCSPTVPVMHRRFLLGLDARRRFLWLLFRGRHLDWKILPSTSQQLKSWFGNVLAARKPPGPSSSQPPFTTAMVAAPSSYQV